MRFSCLLTTVLANQPDILFPHYNVPVECAQFGCAQWKTATDNHTRSLDAFGSTCAIPGEVTGTDKTVTGAWGGPFCFCADAAGKATAKAGYCMNPQGIPEQINLQLASHDTVVAAFVTYEDAKPTNPPQAKIAESAGALNSTSALLGVTHWYVESRATTKTGDHDGRNFSMHFVKFDALKPRTRYFYTLKSGSEGASWSKTLSFRSLYSSKAGGTTRVGIFGDMAVTRYNAVSNLVADCATNTIDAWWMMGDHAYDIGMVDDRYCVRCDMILHA